MKLTQPNIVSVLTLLAVTVGWPPLYAADPIIVTWNQVCRAASGHQLLLTTATSGTVEGFCVGIDVNEISVSTGEHRIVKVARNTLTRIEMRRANGHQLRSLRDGVRGGLRWGFNSLLSPLAPYGAVAIPATLAWGAVATPFCLLGDLKAKAIGTQEIKPN